LISTPRGLKIPSRSIFEIVNPFGGNGLPGALNMMFIVPGGNPDK